MDGPMPSSVLRTYHQLDEDSPYGLYGGCGLITSGNSTFKASCSGLFANEDSKVLQSEIANCSRADSDHFGEPVCVLPLVMASISLS